MKKKNKIKLGVNEETADSKIANENVAILFGFVISKPWLLTFVVVFNIIGKLTEESQDYFAPILQVGLSAVVASIATVSYNTLTSQNSNIFLRNEKEQKNATDVDTQKRTFASRGW